MPGVQPNEPYRYALATFLASQDAVSADDWQALNLTQHLTGALALSPIPTTQNLGQASIYNWDITIRLFLRLSSRNDFLTLSDRWGYALSARYMRSLSTNGTPVTDGYGTRTIFKGIQQQGGYQVEGKENQDGGAEGLVTWRYQWTDTVTDKQINTFDW